MGDDDAGASLHEFGEGLLDGLLAFGVEGGGGFVENEDGRVFEHGAGYAEALALSAAEGDAAVADGGLVAEREGFDEGVGVCDGGGLFDEVEAVVGVAEGNVVGDGVVEEDAVLRNESYLSTETVNVEVGDGYVVDEDGAAGAVIEAWEEVDEGGFACSRGAYYSDGFAAGNGEVGVAEYVDGFGLAVGAVGEGNIAILDTVVEAFEEGCVGFFEDGFVGVDYFVDTLSGGVGFEEVVIDSYYGLNWGDKPCKKDDEENEDGGEEFALEYGETAEDEYEDETEGEEYFGERAAEFAAAGYLYHAAGVGVVGAGESVGGLLLSAEGFDGADAGKRFFEECEEVSESSLAFGSVAAKAFADETDEPNRGGHDEEEIEEEARADEDEDGGEDDDVDGVFAERDDGGEDTPFDVGEVVGDAADDVAAAAGVEIGDREDGDFVVEVVAQASDDAVTHGADDVLRKVAAEVGEE